MSWEEARGVENARKGYYRFGQVLGCDKSFLVATEFLVLCRDRGSLCRDVVLRVQVVSWSRHCIFMSRRCLLLYRDNAAIEVFMSRSRRPRQVAPFVLQHVWSWQGFLCHEKVLLCRNKV